MVGKFIQFICIVVVVVFCLIAMFQRCKVLYKEAKYKCVDTIEISSSSIVTIRLKPNQKLWNSSNVPIYIVLK